MERKPSDEAETLRRENEALRETVQNDARFQELQGSYTQILNLLLSKGDGDLNHPALTSQQSKVIQALFQKRVI